MALSKSTIKSDTADHMASTFASRFPKPSNVSQEDWDTEAENFGADMAEIVDKLIDALITEGL